MLEQKREEATAVLLMMMIDDEDDKEWKSEGREVGSRSVKIVNWEEERVVSQSTTFFFSTMEEVPPILLFFGKKRTGDWVSQSTHPEAPGRGLAGGRWSGLTPPTNFL